MAFTSGPVPERLERQLTATPAAFERDLRAAWPAAGGSVAAGLLWVEEGSLRLELSLRPVGVRRLGLLELPQLVVGYRFAGGDEPARRSLLSRLDRAMQKGGG